MTRARLLLAALAFALGACSEPPAAGPLAQQAYIWQRVWTDGVRAAVATAGPGLAAWRVLVAERSGAGASGKTWHRVAPDWRALAATGRPVTVVVRIDNALARLGDPARDALQRRLLDEVHALWREARAAAHGASIAGLELDYDCGTARLADYAAFAAALRERLRGDGARLSITALPAWLARPRELAALLDAVDGHVLQVHAVGRPREGLWSAERSARWIADWAALAPHPFAIALPSYGTAVRLSARGEILQVSSSDVEPARAWPAGTAQLELMADPLELARFAARLRVERPAKLGAIYWFRLPVAGERRGYSPVSWRLLRDDPAAFVAASEAARPQLRAETVDGIAGALRWHLGNGAGVDLRMPAVVRMPAGCAAPQALGATTADADGGLRTHEPLLRAGATVELAVAHCAGMGATELQRYEEGVEIR